MTEELVEKVARVMAGHFGPVYDELARDRRHFREWQRDSLDYTTSNTQSDFLEAARAVIPVVLEEAARVADAEAGHLREEADQIPGVPSRTEQRVAEFIACAIRNLGSNQ